MAEKEGLHRDNTGYFSHEDQDLRVEYRYENLMFSRGTGQMSRWAKILISFLGSLLYHIKLLGGCSEDFFMQQKVT